MIKFKGILLLFALIFVFAYSAQGSDLMKIETFFQFSEVAGFEKQYNQMMHIFVTNFQQGMITGFQNGIQNKDIRPDIKEKLIPFVNQAANNLKNGFETIFKNEIQFRDLVEKVYFPTYRKHFSEGELKELITFYKSPIGMKFSNLTPEIMQDSSEKFNQIYGNKVQIIGGELLKKEIEVLIKKVEELQD